jgi:hypothetical protein
VPADGEVFIAATGGAVAAGQPIELAVSGVPHHSPTPRRVALTLALVIMLAGAWTVARRPVEDPATTIAAERKRLLTRRDKLFNDLVRLERGSIERPRGRSPVRRAARRSSAPSKGLQRPRQRRHRAGAGPPRRPHRAPLPRERRAPSSGRPERRS